MASISAASALSLSTNYEILSKRSLKSTTHHNFSEGCCSITLNRKHTSQHYPKLSPVVKASSETEVEVDVEVSKKDPREGLEEKFAVIDTGKWECKSCGFTYDQTLGDPSYPIPSGLDFKALPEDWRCPTCGAAQSLFVSKSREVAGFAQNQSYGFGTNSMTSEQKNLLIWGSLGFFFFLFISGYFLE